MNIGAPELLILLAIALVVLLPVALVAFLVVFLVRRSRPQAGQPPWSAPPPPGS